MICESSFLAIKYEDEINLILTFSDEAKTGSPSELW